MPVERSDGLLTHNSVWKAERFGQTFTFVQSAVATQILPQFTLSDMVNARFLPVCAKWVWTLKTNAYLIDPTAYLLTPLAR
jgi:hypothetical protein